MAKKSYWAVPLCLEVAPSALLAGSVCVAFAAAAPVAALAAAVPWAAGAGAGLASWRLLSAIGRSGGDFDVPAFELVAVEPVEGALPELLLSERADGEAAGELLLTEAIPGPGDDELLLEDRLAPAGPDSRVIRLFERDDLPTAGALRSRIERHLSGARPAGPPLADATAELHQALMDLRRSLR